MKLSILSESNPAPSKPIPTQAYENLYLRSKKSKKKLDHVYYGDQTFQLDTNWQAIASLTLNDTLLEYTLEPNADIELAYSKRDNMYYIRSKSGEQRIRFEFLLHSPPKPKLEPQFQKLIDDYNYGSQALIFDTPGEHTGEEYLNAIEDQKQGACRHRSIACKDALDREGIQSRIIENDCHMFIELNSDGQWVSCDLGGHEGNIKPIEPIIPKEPVQPNPYDIVFETWNQSPANQELEFKHYEETLLQAGEHRNVLIELDNKSKVDALLINLQKQCLASNRPFFYIHSPSDLLYLSDYMKASGRQGQIVPGPGGPLYDFLTTTFTKNNPPVIFINYPNCDDELAKIVSLTETGNRHLGSISIPDETLIIGAVSTNTTAFYEDISLYQSFDKKDLNPKTTATLLESVIPPTELNNTALIPINLFHGGDWKTQLLGQWVMKPGGHYEYHSGLLQAALQQGKSLEIQNGLWEDPEFKFFWDEALSLGQIKLNGETLDLKGLKCFQSEGYPWSSLQKQLVLNPDLQDFEAVLNPFTLNTFFKKIQCDNHEKTLNTIPGLLEKAQLAKQSFLNVYLTHNLNVDEWAKLLTQCAKMNITLNVKPAPGIQLIKELGGLQIPEYKPKIQWTRAQKKEFLQVIESTDPDKTISKLKHADPSWTVINCSETKPAELLVETQVHYNKAKRKPEFTQQKRALLKALNEGKHIILTGTASAELAQALAPELLTRQKNPKALGKLAIVSDQLSSFQYLTNKSIHKVRTATGEASMTLRARKQFPKGWEGLYELKFDAKVLGSFNPATAKEEAKAFNAKRNKLVFDVLNQSPFVFIAGLSGVGKSTWVEKELRHWKPGYRAKQKRQAPHKLYHGQNNLSTWAKDSSDRLKVLFLDEETLTGKQRTEMEGLLSNSPPKILIGGVLYTLSPNHKIIFAGNPVNYGDRELASFFVHHGRAVIFDPLPLSVVYESILKPVFKDSPFDTQAAELAQPILAVYQFLCVLSEEEVLISPRELQMMAILTLSYSQQNPQVPIAEVAKYYAYTLAKGLVPAGKRQAFDDQFGNTKLKPLPLSEKALERFNTKPETYVSSSRNQVLQDLHDFLSLAENRQSANSQNEVLRSGGLGGILIEAPDKVIPDELLLNYLYAQDYEQELDLTHPTLKKKPLYILDPTLSLAGKRQLLIKASREGAKVFIKNINAFPMMEDLLNDLLMGKSPDKKPVEVPGFMVIATKKSREASDARPSSTALERRFHTITLGMSSEDELLDQLTGKNSCSDELRNELNLLINAFIKKSQEAKQRVLKPAPTINLLYMMAQEIKTRFKELKEYNSNRFFDSNQEANRGQQAANRPGF